MQPGDETPPARLTREEMLVEMATRAALMGREAAELALAAIAVMRGDMEPAGPMQVEVGGPITSTHAEDDGFLRVEDMNGSTTDAPKWPAYGGRDSRRSGTADPAAVSTTDSTT